MTISDVTGTVSRVVSEGLFGGAKSQGTAVQLFRYTFVGGGAFVVDFSLLYFCTEFIGIHYLVSAGISFMCGLLTNYLLSIAWVFGRRRVEKRWIEFGIFLLIGIVGVGLNIFSIWFFTEVAGFYYMTSKVAAVFFVYMWNFWARKIVLF